MGSASGLAQVRQLGEQQQADALEDVGGVVARDAALGRGSRRSGSCTCRGGPPRPPRSRGRIRAPAARRTRTALCERCPGNGQRLYGRLDRRRAPLDPARQRRRSRGGRVPPLAAFHGLMGVPREPTIRIKNSRRPEAPCSNESTRCARRHAALESSWAEAMPYHARVASLLEVADLTVHYEAPGAGPAVVVRDLSLKVESGQVVGLLGESGCGKSTLLLALLGLLPPAARVVSRVRPVSAAASSSVSPRPSCVDCVARRSRFVFQDPALALNPVRRVGSQVAEVLAAHRAQSRRRSREDALAILGDVGLPEPARLYDAYPHELSGGQRQRVVIAQALAVPSLAACSPTSRRPRSTPPRRPSCARCCARCRRASSLRF